MVVLWFCSGLAIGRGSAMVILWLSLRFWHGVAKVLLRCCYSLCTDFVVFASWFCSVLYVLVIVLLCRVYDFVIVLLSW